MACIDYIVTDSNIIACIISSFRFVTCPSIFHIKHENSNIMNTHNFEYLYLRHGNVYNFQKINP